MPITQEVAIVGLIGANVLVFFTARVIDQRLRFPLVGITSLATTAVAAIWISRLFVF